MRTTERPLRARAGSVELAYYRRGAGVPILFVMGLGGRAADWNVRFLQRLTDDFEAITLDNRGTGASDHPDGDYSLEVMADEAMAVLDACGHSRAHVVGLSMGGMIAQLVALRHPQRVARLVLLGTHAGGPTVVPPTPRGMAALLPDVTRPPAQLARDAMTAITAPGFAEREPAAVSAFVDLALAQPTPPMTFARQMSAILASDRTGRLAEIRAQTLVVHGTDDPLIPPENGAILARGIPGARLHELPGVGHLAQWECPERLAEVLTDFIGAG